MMLSISWKNRKKVRTKVAVFLVSVLNGHVLSFTGASLEMVSNNANAFTVTLTTPQKKRQVAKVTPFEKAEEQVENEGSDNLAQEVFMLETRDSLDSPPLNEIEDDPLAGFESNEGINDAVQPQPSTSSGFGMLRLANFAIDPANVSSSSNQDNSLSIEQSSSWHIAQGVAPPEEPDPSIQMLMSPPSYISSLPVEPLPPDQAFSSNFSTFVVQPPPSQVVQPSQTNLTVQFPLQLLSKELNICYPLLCNTEAHRSDYVILTMHMNNSINYFAKLFIPLRKASMIFSPRSLPKGGNLEYFRYIKHSMFKHHVLFLFFRDKYYYCINDPIYDARSEPL